MHKFNILLNKIRLYFSSIKNINSQESLLNEITILRKNNEKLFHDKKLDKIINNYQYCTIMMLDIMTSIKLLAISNNFWQEKFCARIILLTIFEFTDDIKGLFNKEYFHGIKELANDEIVNEHKIIMKKIHKFSTLNRNHLKKIRINIIGHREQEASKQLKYINNLDIEDTINICMDFISINTDLARWQLRFNKFISEDLKI